jgi:putative PIN family toxin of toxin-antitoxin system
MRVVADTSTVVSGLMWRGKPRQVLDAARTRTISLFTSTTLLAELEDVLNRDKFARRLALIGHSPRDLLVGYAALATIVTPAAISPVILVDPDDDAVLACAVAASAKVVVSGDSHLLALKKYQNILILKAAELLECIAI